MELRQITEHCYYSTSDAYGMRPSLGYIKVADDVIVMVNAGNSERHMKDFIDLLAVNNLKVPNKGLITTSKWNHTFGLQSLISDSRDKFVTRLENDAAITFGCSLSVQKHIEENSVAFLKKALYLKSSASPFNTLACCDGFSAEEVESIKAMNEEYIGNFDSIRIACPDDTSPKAYYHCNFNGLDVALVDVYADKTCDATFVYVEEDKVIYGGDFLHNITSCIPDDSASKYLVLKKLTALKHVLDCLDFEYFVSSYETVHTKSDVFRYIKRFKNVLISYEA